MTSVGTPDHRLPGKGNGNNPSVHDRSKSLRRRVQGTHLECEQYLHPPALYHHHWKSDKSSSFYDITQQASPTLRRRNLFQLKLDGGCYCRALRPRKLPGTLNSSVISRPPHNVVGEQERPASVNVHHPYTSHHSRPAAVSHGEHY